MLIYFFITVQFKYRNHWTVISADGSILCYIIPHRRIYSR